ncbi:hypothetical protein FOB64_001509 [Candida albicans]|uniref:Agglutinin-like protein N-terminal domain-containing protein n=1 Tax=Candida albicans TaxID=5476 RepID=A0A8H6F6D8_CANAX|nr:hypothetical protein FOB64_001509 [Candida albicans]
MKKLYLLYLLASFTTVISKEVTGVFNQFNSLIWSYTYRARYEEISTLTAKAQLEWALDGTIASPGDTFTLVMPCVYKFMTYETSVQLTANSIAYATCDFDAGEDTKSFSSLKCTVTDELTEDTSVFGSVILPIAFNVGGSGSKSTITDSKCFSSGYNTVTFFDGNNQLSTTANFLPRRELAFGLVVSQRLSMSLDTMTNFVMSTPCFMGYQSGKLGFTSNDDDFEIDCSSIHVGITNEINDWSMPVSSVPFDHTIRCTSRALYIEFKTIPAGYRPFVDAIVQIPTTEPFFVKYTNEFACVNGIYTSIPFTSFFSQPILYDEALAIGADLVRTTSTVIGSITRTTTLPFISRLQKTKTILVLEPIPTTTVTTSHHGFDTWYYTKKATIGDTATVFIDVPQHTATTLTTYWQESSTATTTYFDDIDLVDTVIVKIPYPNPTIITTQFWSGKYLTTETHKEPPLGTDSVIIKEPHNPTVTTTEFWSESFATTETVTNGPEGTDSVIIKEPHNPTVTTTKFWSESFATTETVTNGPEGTDSVIIKEPHNPTVTTTEFWSESYATTETITNYPEGTDSVIVREPHNPTVTTTEFWSESFATTETITNGPEGTDSVIIKEPHNPTVTTTKFWSESFATTETVTNGPEGTDSVIVREPHNPTVTTTEFWSESFATTETITNGPEGTDSVIIKEPHNPTVTTTEFWSESYATTETVTNGPEGTDSVIIKEPHNPTVTTTKFWSESFATTETITTGPLGTDSIVIHDPLEESSSSTAIESSDSNISSSAQDSSSSVEQSFTSADETSSIVELSSSSDIPSSSIGLTSSESSTVSSYDSYSSSTSESSIASSYDSYSSSSIESSTLSSSDRYSSSISDTTSFWDSSSSDLESTSITWSSSIDAQSSHLVQSVSNSISTSQEISSSSSEESSTSATDALVSSDASSILSSDTSSYYPSSTISPSDDFPHTIAGDDSVSLTSDPASSFDSSSRLNSDSSSSPSTDQRDILTSSSFSTLIKSSESRESSSGTILSEESSDSIPTTFSTRYWSPSGMSSRHYTNSTETSVSDVVSSSVAGDETSESSVSVTSESSESVTSESVASESVTSESVASESVTSESVTSESVTSESVASESVTSESVASESVTAVSDISDLYTTSEVVSTSDSKIVPSTSVPSSEQRSSIPIMSSSDESSESRESSSGTILSEENSDSIPTTFSTRYVSVSLTVGELSALPSLPGKLSHLPSSLSETSIGMTKSANLSPQFFSTSVDSALSYWASGSSSADHQSSATCDVSESSVEGNLSAMALGMSNSDDGLSEDTRSSSVAGKEEIELTSTNSVGEITLISYSSSSPTTHDHGRVSKSMGAAPLSSLFSVSVHAPLVTGLSDSDTFPSENSNRSRSFKESTDNTISISRESLGNPYSSISSPSDYDVKSFTTSRELVSSESILPFSDVMDANDMPTSGSEKFNANIEKHKNTNGHYSSMVFTYQSAGLEESDQRIAVTNTKFDQNKIDTTIDSNTFVTSLPFATTSNDQIDQAVPIKIPASSTAGFVSDVLKPDYSKSVQAESVQTDSTTYLEMMSSKRNKNSGFGTSSLNLKPTITVVTKSIDTKVNTMKEGGVSKQVSTTVTEQYDTSTYTPASLLVSDNSGSVSKYSLWMMAFYMLFGLF